MNKKVKAAGVWTVSLVLAYLSGLMSSSFAIGDSNLLVSTVSTLFFIVTVLWAGRSARRMSTPTKVAYCLILVLTFVLGFVLSIKGIV